MNEWLQKTNDLIILALGNEHSSVERIIIAVCGIIAFFLILKLFTKVDGGGNTAWLRRFLAAAVILGAVLLGAVAADVFVVPYVTNNIIQKVVLVVIPALVLVLVAAPLLMLVLRKDYGSTLVTITSSIIAACLAVFMVGFIIDSFQGSDKEFKSLKKRTNNIDEFINQ